MTLVLVFGALVLAGREGARLGGRIADLDLDRWNWRVRLRKSDKHEEQDPRPFRSDGG